PLHKGIVCGETLRCAYHAWTYRTDGRLVGVPYLPKNAVRPAGVRGYACREAYGYVLSLPDPQHPAGRIRGAGVQSVGRVRAVGPRAAQPHQRGHADDRETKGPDDVDEPRDPSGGSPSPCSPRIAWPSRWSSGRTTSKGATGIRRSTR